MTARRVIPLNEHPSNLDMTARLVSGPRDEVSIYRVRGGYLATRDLLTFTGLFRTEADARAAWDRHDEACSCRDRSWYGDEHDSACRWAGQPRDGMPA